MIVNRGLNLLLMVLTAAAVIPGACAMGQQPAVAPAPATGPAIVQDIDQLAATLNNSQARQEVREEAARRLVLRPSPQAAKVLGDALSNPNQPLAQIAAAKALADYPRTDSDLIYPLFGALNGTPPLPGLAMRALTHYRDQPEVFTGMLVRIQGTNRAPDAVRREIIRQLGSFVEKRTADVLINVLRTPNESQSVRDAATDALVDLTGLVEIGRDANRWIEWWQRNVNRPETEFRAEMLTRRSARFDQVKQELNDAVQAWGNLLRLNYQAAASAGGAQKLELLLSYLRSSRAEERAIGASLVWDDALTNVPIQSEARDQLRQMIGDSSPKVRFRVAQALAQINDADSLDPLLSQLALEPDSQVRAALAQAIAPIKSLRAVEALLKLLDDSYLPAALEGAKAIELLGQTIREQEPRLAEPTAATLRTRLAQLPANTGNADLREALVRAMAPLRQPILLRDPLQRILAQQNNESAEMRRLAVKAIGEIGDPLSRGTLHAVLTDNDDSVRLEGVVALGKLPPSIESVSPLRGLLGPSERDVSIRNKAWTVLESIFPHLSKELLSDLADKFKDDTARRISVLKALAAKLVQEQSPAELADVQLNIGAALLNEQNGANGPDPKAAEEAAPFLRQALEHKSKLPNPAAVVIADLTRDLMRALLRSGQYSEAVIFGSEAIRKDQQTLPIVGSAIRNEAEYLQNGGKVEEALKLIEQTKTMSPRLGEQYERPLEAVERWAIDQRNRRSITPDQLPPQPLDVYAPMVRPTRIASTSN